MGTPQILLSNVKIFFQPQERSLAKCCRHLSTAFPPTQNLIVLINSPLLYRPLLYLFYAIQEVTCYTGLKQ